MRSGARDRLGREANCGEGLLTFRRAALSFPGKALRAFAIGLAVFVLFGLFATGSTARPGAAPSFRVYAGYYDTHHGADPQRKPKPWQGAPNVVFVGQSDSLRGGWDTSAIRIDNLSGSRLRDVGVSVDIGPGHIALWGTNSIPVGKSLILAQTGNATFDGSDENPAGCYGCDPTLCAFSTLFPVPVVHVTINGRTMDVSDSKRVLDTHGVDGAGCSRTRSSRIRSDESAAWQRLR
jgi:hypothetical protein